MSDAGTIMARYVVGARPDHDRPTASRSTRSRSSSSTSRPRAVRPPTARSPRSVPSGSAAASGWARSRPWSTLASPSRAYVAHLTGIDDRMVRGAPPIEAVLPSFLEFARGAVFVAHNARSTGPSSTPASTRLDHPPIARPRRVHGQARAPGRVARRPQRPAGHPRALLPHPGATDAPGARRRRGHRRGPRRAPRARPAPRHRHAWASCPTRARRGVARTSARSRWPTTCPRAPACTCSAAATAASCTSASRSTSGPGSSRTSTATAARRSRICWTQVASVEGLATPGGEIEALVLEARLIAAHEPPYNRRGKRWRSYTYLKLDPGEAWPRLKHRDPGHADAVHLGPFPSRSRGAPGEGGPRGGVPDPSVHPRHGPIDPLLALRPRRHGPLPGAVRRPDHRRGVPRASVQRARPGARSAPATLLELLERRMARPRRAAALRGGGARARPPPRARRGPVARTASTRGSPAAPDGARRAWRRPARAREAARWRSVHGDAAPIGAPAVAGARRRARGAALLDLPAPRPRRGSATRRPPSPWPAGAGSPTSASASGSRPQRPPARGPRAGSRAGPARDWTAWSGGHPRGRADPHRAVPRQLRRHDGASSSAPSPRSRRCAARGRARRRRPDDRRARPPGGERPEHRPPGLAFAPACRRRSPAFNVNIACGSGMKAVQLAAQQIAARRRRGGAGRRDGEHDTGPVPAARRCGSGIGSATPRSSTRMYRDGLLDPLCGLIMGETAENLVDRYDIGREEQDAFALRSQRARRRRGARPEPSRDRLGRDAPAWRPGDRHRGRTPRPDTTMASLGALAPVFRDGGSVTAGNSSGITDGAAALVLMSETRAAAEGRGTPRLASVAWSWAGVPPEIMGIGPVPATQKVLERTGLTIDGHRPDRDERGVRRAGHRVRAGAEVRP